jgi:hypothetical protein
MLEWPVPGLPPNQWKFVPFADVGTSEEFVRVFLEIAGDLLGGTAIPEPRKKAAKNAIMNISMNGLTPAFMHLRNIRTSVGVDLPVLNTKQLYEDFVQDLWRSYKDLTQKAVKAMGSDIGFLYQTDTNFEKGLSTFMGTDPRIAWHVLADSLRSQRRDWQNGLAEFRNNLEHGGKLSLETHSQYYEPEMAERLFAVVWQTIADILTVFICLNMWPMFGLRLATAEDRTGGWPNRYRCVILSHSQATDVLQCL